MARGKYANSAEARRARESAESEVVAGRRTIARLTTEVSELRATIAKERQESSDRLRKYVTLMEEGSSPEVERLRNELRIASATAAEVRTAVGKEVSQLLQSRSDFVARPEFYAALASTIGIEPRELFGFPNDDSRDMRRMTAAKIRARAQMENWADSGPGMR